jgi:hypothetical protein
MFLSPEGLCNSPSRTDLVCFTYAVPYWGKWFASLTPGFVSKLREKSEWYIDKTSDAHDLHRFSIGIK